MVVPHICRFCFSVGYRIYFHSATITKHTSKVFSFLIRIGIIDFLFIVVILELWPNLIKAKHEDIEISSLLSENVYVA